jgi:hypothetical protein
MDFMMSGTFIQVMDKVHEELKLYVEFWAMP